MQALAVSSMHRRFIFKMTNEHSHIHTHWLNACSKAHITLILIMRFLYFALPFYPNANATQIVLLLLHIISQHISVNLVFYLKIMKTCSQNVVVMSVQKGN